MAKELLKTKHSTPLEIEFEQSLCGGIKHVKARVKQAHEAIAQRNQRALEMEEETIKLEEGYVIAVETQNRICQQIRDVECKLHVVDKELMATEKRLDEKEEFLRELSTFQTGESIKEAMEMEQFIKKKKKIYRENYNKFQRAKEKKFALDSKQKRLESQARASEEKIKSLTYEISQLNVEHERHENECEKAKASALLTANENEKMERDVDNITKRLEDALEKIDSLKVHIANKESELSSLTSERSTMEESIKKIFSVAIQEFEKCERIDPS